MENPTTPPATIHRSETFFGPKGMRVDVLRPLDGEGPTLYVGQAFASVPVLSPVDAKTAVCGNVAIPVRFEISADSLEAAFASFESTLEAFKQAQQSAVAVARKPGLSLLS
jgi:hypothetical protein